MVMVTLELPRDLVDWIDGLKVKMGFRSRGFVVAQLIRELIPEPETLQDESNAENAA
jgi:metal-responsive CopG/Arc/MetJ family transcriptional regulator